MAKTLTDDQHALLHQYWPPPDCCLCNHEKRIEELVRENERLREALQHCWGQEPGTGDLLFVVRVKGLPAMSLSPLQAAKELAAMWCPALWQRFNPLCNVSVEPRGAALEEMGDV